jgi:hypothetical protein
MYNDPINKLSPYIKSETHMTYCKEFHDPFKHDFAGPKPVLVSENVVEVSRSGDELYIRVVKLRSRGFTLRSTKRKPYLHFQKEVAVFNPLTEEFDTTIYVVQMNLNSSMDTTCTRCGGGGIYPSKAYNSICLACGGCGAKLK